MYMNLQLRIKRALKRARYAAMGAAVGAAIGGLFGRSSASTGGATGAFVGAVIAEKRYTTGGWLSMDDQVESSDEDTASGSTGLSDRIKQKTEKLTPTA